MVDLPRQVVFGYFRMGLVTGLVDKQTVIDWADNEILKSPNLDDEIIELSLSSKLPYSQLIRLLSSFQGEPDYDLPLKMLFARARKLLVDDFDRGRAILMGLRLLKEEEYLPAEISAKLRELAISLDQYKQALLSQEEFTRCLTAFLDPYKEYSTI